MIGHKISHSRILDWESSRSQWSYRYRRFETLGNLIKLEKWMSHDLSNRQSRFEFCSSFLTRNKNESLHVIKRGFCAIAEGNQDSGLMSTHPQALPEGRNPTKKKDDGNRVVVGGWRDSLQVSGARRNHHSRLLLWRNRRDIPKIALAAAGIGQQKMFHSSARHRPLTCFPNHKADYELTFCLTRHTLQMCASRLPSS